MINKKIICGFVGLVFYSSLAFSINLKLLDLHADSFNGRIWSKVDSPITLIQERLGFLDETDIKGYIHSEDIFDITVHNDDLYYKGFAENCRKIYKNHANIDELTQIAVSMLFKKVSEKYLEHHRLINSIEIPSIKIPQPPLKEISNFLGNILKEKGSLLGSNGKDIFVLGALSGEIHVYRDILKFSDEDIVKELLKSGYPEELIIKHLKNR